MNTSVLRTVFTRSLISYFTNPVGWVFFSLLLLLHVFAALWRDVSADDWLSRAFMYELAFAYAVLGAILTVMISTWSEQRRGEADELVPEPAASDSARLWHAFYVTLGKFFVGATVLTLALAFSLAFAGLFLEAFSWTTYACFWVFSLAVLAVGVGASCVSRAVFMRNFLGYFSNPTGYVFICLFVLLSSIAAFWPHEFFGANLANLDQLSKWFPFIMLVFIPAITMSIWADERSQGTDELLLTVPAADFDIVTGKYLAAAAIYTVSLLFSLVSNYCVLDWLGDPDLGLFQATYVGYWLLGLAMLAIGMVASFLTANVTVSYILGVMFNAPLVFFAEADTIMARQGAMQLKQWSIGEQFSDFGRGVLSLSGLAYFAMIVIVMLYLSMVLIGRRHWIRGRDWYALGAQHAVRVIALLVIAVGLISFTYHHDLRADATSERLSSLSPRTVEMLEKLQADFAEGKIKQPVKIEAFISPEVPEAYVQARINLLAMLRELDSRGGDLIEVQMNEVGRFSPEADAIKDRYGITPHQVFSRSRGTMSERHIFLDVAISCGLKRVPPVFIDRGVPVEYELIRSLCTVTQQQRKRIGVVKTDAEIFSRFDGRSETPDWRIIQELKKQYDVVQIDPSRRRIPTKGEITRERVGAAIATGAAASIQIGAAGGVALATHTRSEMGTWEEGFDALLAIQPSTLGPEAMENFLAAVRRGQPTAIFEDPCPHWALFAVPPTAEPRRVSPQQMQMWQQSQMMSMFSGRTSSPRPPPPPKGNIKPLWRMLGINFSGDNGEENEADENQPDPFRPFPFDDFKQKKNVPNKAVWDKFNPHPKLRDILSQEENVFVHKGSGAEEPFGAESPISSKLQDMLLVVPGSMTKLRTSKMESYVPLLRTGPDSGTVRVDEVFVATRRGRDFNPLRRQTLDDREHVLAAHFQGESQDRSSADEETGAKINVVLVADVDMLCDQFFLLRERGADPEFLGSFNPDNVTFILNALDTLAGDPRFVELRKRRPIHRTLTRIDEKTKQTRKDTAQVRDQAEEEFQVAIKKAQEAQDKQSEKEDPLDLGNRQRQELETDALRERLRAERRKLQQDRNRTIEDKENELEREIKQLQDTYKMWAVLLPPIPPLLLAIGVFITRRIREREGISRDRLR